MEPCAKLPLTSKCRHYTTAQNVPKKIRKYWQQRYRIWPSYDNNIRLTDDAWFGVTPESVAFRLSQDLGDLWPSKTAVVDMFGGAGGNSIAFALSGRWDRVVAVERDESTLACAQHNAEMCGVAEGKITWVLGDSFEYAARLLDPERLRDLHESLRLDPESVVFFASPPWGGPGYSTSQIFDLTLMEPYSLHDLSDAYRTVHHVLYLPRTSDLRQLAALAPAGTKIDIVQYCVDGASKAMVAYIPGIKE